MKSFVSLSRILLTLLGASLLSFGLYNIHAPSGITEGGIFGLTLLLDHHFGISPSITSLIANALCYGFGIRVLGREFLFYSLLAGGWFSVSYALLELTPPLFPFLTGLPLASALLGALFIGVGAGLCVRCGGAPSGDDAFAMAAARRLHLDIRYLYLLSDLLILSLSLTYIPIGKILYSLLTVVLSGQIIGLMQKFPRRRKKTDGEYPAFRKI